MNSSYSHNTNTHTMHTAASSSTTASNAASSASASAAHSSTDMSDDYGLAKRRKPNDTSVILPMDTLSHTDELIIKTILTQSSISELIDEMSTSFVKTNAQNNKCKALLDKLNQPELPHFVSLPSFKNLFSDNEEKQYKDTMLPLIKKFESELKIALITCKQQTAASTKTALDSFENNVKLEANERLNNLMQDEITRHFIGLHRDTIVRRIVQSIKHKATKRIFEQASTQEKRLLNHKRHEEKMDVAEAEVNADPAKTFRDIALQVVNQALKKQGRTSSNKSSRASSTKSNESTRSKSRKPGNSKHKKKNSQSKKRQVAFSTKKAGKNQKGHRGNTRANGARNDSHEKTTGKKH